MWRPPKKRPPIWATIGLIFMTFVLTFIPLTTSPSLAEVVGWTAIIGVVFWVLVATHRRDLRRLGRWLRRHVATPIIQSHNRRRFHRAGRRS